VNEHKNKEGEQKSKDAWEGERTLDSCPTNLRLSTNINLLALGDRRLMGKKELILGRKKGDSWATTEHKKKRRA
jgi:hypothetical protein